MTDATDDTTAEPQPDDLWVLYNDHEKADASRLAIGQIIDENDEQRPLTGDDERIYIVRLYYDTYTGLTSTLETPYTMNTVKESDLYARLPDDEFTPEYEAALEHVRQLIGYDETLDVLTGNTHKTDGREGYEGLRFFILDGVFESITEFSVGHGHGATRYASAVENRLADIPDHLISDALHSEKGRWEGGFELSDDAASKIVEILELMEQYLDEDHEDEITTLVNEYNLRYDKYMDGHFTGLYCPSCGEELIERPEDDDGDILLDCSSCVSSYAGNLTDDGLLIGPKQEGDTNGN